MREADRIKEKILIRLDGKQIGGLMLGAAIIAGGVFWAGYFTGSEFGRQPASAPTAVVVEAPIAERASPAPAVAPAQVLPPRFTYDRELTKPTAPVQIDDPTLQIGHLKREELQAKEKAAAQRAMTAFAEKKLGEDAAILPPAGPNAPPPPHPAPEPAAVAAPDEAPADAAADPAPEAPADAPVDSAPQAGAKGFYTIQIKAFRNKGEAREFMSVLAQGGHKAYTQSVNIPGKGRFHRVRMGKFSTLEAAEAKRKAFIRAEGLEAIVAPFE